MSSRRSSKQHAASSSRITDDQIIHLISKLHQVLPPNDQLGRGTTRRCSEKVSGARVLQETCNYIRSLHREIDNLCERLSQVLATLDIDSPEAAIIRTLLDM